MMTVEQLIEELKKLDPKAHVATRNGCGCCDSWEEPIVEPIAEYSIFDAHAELGVKKDEIIIEL